MTGAGVDRPTQLPPPPPPAPVRTASSPQPAWWQRWQVVLAFVVAAFATGLAAGLALWVALGDDGARVASAEQANGLVGAELPGTLVPEADAGASEVAVPRAELTVGSDGCGVIRSEFERDPRGLQWRILDEEGFQVLGRNAIGETRYRYFRAGTYTVTLVAWDGRSHAPISNTVTISC